MNPPCQCMVSPCFATFAMKHFNVRRRRFVQCFIDVFYFGNTSISMLIIYNHFTSSIMFNE